MRLVGSELHKKVLGDLSNEFAELAFFHAGPREDAACALGLAVGLLFAGGVR